MTRKRKTRFDVVGKEAPKKRRRAAPPTEINLQVQLLSQDKEMEPDLPKTLQISIPESWPVVGLLKEIEIQWRKILPSEKAKTTQMEVQWLYASEEKSRPLNYNKPLRTYFKNGEKIVAVVEVLKIIPPKPESEKLPVTILTGFLGAGKTTLMNYILKEKHGHKFFVIQNEFGQVSVDDDLVREEMKGDSKERFVSLDNGCMCCKVRGDLFRVFKDILDNDYDIEGVLVETTGMADPTPVVATFSKIPGVSKKMRLDAVVTVVAANHIEMQLARDPGEGSINEAVNQVCAADVIILNKLDLVDPKALSSVKKNLRALNPYAKLIPATKARIDLDKILNVQAFSLEKLVDEEITEQAKEAECTKKDCTDKGHGHGHGKSGHGHGHGHGHGKSDKVGGEKGHGHRHDHDHQHSSGVSSVGLKIEGEIDMQKFQKFFSQMDPKDVYRVKGILKIAGKQKKFVFHGVHDLMDFTFSEKKWPEGEVVQNKFVIIGKNMEKADVEKKFRECLV